MADSKNDSVNVIDGTTNMVIDTIHIENDCDILLNEVTNRIYVASAVGNPGSAFKEVSIGVIDGETDEIVATLRHRNKCFHH